MKKLFHCDMKRRTMTDICAEDLKRLHTKVIAIDADNTACVTFTTAPLPGVEEWIAERKKEGFSVILVSNAQTKRSRVLGDALGIPTVGTALKPLPFGYWRACLKMRVRPKHMTMIGDQLLTDALGANLAGVNMIYVFPYEMEPRAVKLFAAKRHLEELIFTAQEMLEYQKALKKHGKEENK